MMWSATRASPTFVSFWSIVRIPTALPIANDATTNASQPKIAIFRCLALQRPMRAAMLVLCFRGDISGSFPGSDVTSPGCHPSALPTVRRSGVLGCGYPHPRGSGLQKREHGEHATMVVGGRRQFELREDARHMLLDRSQRHEEPVRDRLVRASLRHQLHDLALARSETLQRVVASAAAE